MLSANVLEASLTKPFLKAKLTAEGSLDDAAAEMLRASLAALRCGDDALA